MATYSTNLALTLMATGEQSNTWGDTTNTNLGTLLEQAISGYVTQAITDGSSANTTITIPDGATGVARNMFIEMTGALTFSTTSLIVPANKKMYFVYNNTSGGFAVTVKVSGQTGILVPNGKKVILTCNGTDIVEAHTAIVGNATMGGTLGVTGATTLSSTLGVTGITTLGAALVGPASATVFNTVSTTVNAFGAATTLNIGNASGTTAIAGAATVGTTLGVTGNATIGGFAASAFSIGKSLEVYAVGNGLWNSGGPSNIRLITNLYYAAGDYKFAGTGYGATLVVNDGSLNFYVSSASGTAGNTPTMGSKFSITNAGAVTIPGTLGVTGNTTIGGFAASAWSLGKALEVGFVGSGVYGRALNDVYLTNNYYYNSGDKFAGTGYASVYEMGAGVHYWYTSSASGTAGNAATMERCAFLNRTGLTINCPSGSGAQNLSLYDSVDEADHYYLIARQANGTVIGSIRRNASTSAIVYNTTSDYRVKDIFGKYTGALDVIGTLTVHDGQYKGGEIRKPLILAHEGVAWATSGEKDGVDGEGNPDYQMIDYAAYVPLLIAGIQEIRADFQAYKQSHP